MVMKQATLAALDLGLLRVFEALMTERQVTRAARRLNLTQSAVSNALARLRLLFDDELFIRTARGMEPTMLATEIARPIIAALDNLRGALTKAASFDPASATVTFRLAMSEYAELVLAPRLIGRLRALAPSAHLAIRHAEKEDALRLIEEDAVELAIGMLPKGAPQMSQASLLKDRLVTLLRRDHPAAKRLTRQRFLDFPHILISAAGNRRGAVDRVLAREGAARNLATVVSHLSTVPQVLRDSDYLCTLPERVAREIAAPYGLVIVPTPVEVEDFIALGMAWHRRHDRQPAALWLRGVIEEICRMAESAAATARPRRRD